VPEAVVDVLEAVDIDIQRCHGDTVAAGTSEHLLGAIERQDTVRQAGQRVVEGLVAQALLKRLAL
jgi:hypothetical protein